MSEHPGAFGPGPGYSGPGSYASDPGPGPTGYGQPFGGAPTGGPSYGAGPAGGPAYGTPTGPTGPHGTPPYGQPPRPNSHLKMVAIIVAGVVLLAAIGAVVMVFTSGKDGRAGGFNPTTNPTSSTVPTQPPTTQPTTDPTGNGSKAPTSDPTTSTSTPPNSNPDRVDLGHGIGVVPAPLYKLQDKAEGYAAFTNGNDQFVARVVTIASNTDPGRYCVSELTSLNQGSSAVKIPNPQVVNGNPKLKIATCQSSALFSDGGGTQIRYAGSVISVRLSDGVTVVGTIVFNTSSVGTQVNQDVSQMVGGMLVDQANG